MTNLFSNINYAPGKNSDFIFHEEINPHASQYICGGVNFEHAIYFARIEDNADETIEQLINGQPEEYGTLSVFYFPQDLIEQAQLRIENIKKSILQNKMVAKDLSIIDFPKGDYTRKNSNIGFAPWISEYTSLTILTKKYNNGLFVVVNNNDQNSCEEFEYFSFAKNSSEKFDENEFCYLIGEENTGENSNGWLKKFPDYLNALKNDLPLNLELPN